MVITPNKPTRGGVFVLLRPVALIGVVLGIILMIDVSVSPVEACMQTTTTPATTITSTSTAPTTTTTVACSCPMLSTLLRTAPETPAGPRSVKNGVVTFPGLLDSSNCQKEISCSVKKGFVPQLFFRGAGGGKHRTFGPIDTPLVQDVTCKNGVWHRDGVPARNQPFNKFACVSIGLKCPCPKLSSLEKTNAGAKETNVPLIIAKPKLNPITHCEERAMVDCHTKDEKPFFRLTGTSPADTTTGRQNSVIVKHAHCQKSTGTWRAKDSQGANYDFTGMRCFFKT